MSRYDDLKVESIDKLRESLDEIAREGSLRMLRDVLEREVVDFLGRGRYERAGEFNGYRNGYGKKRKVAMGSGTVELQAPRVRESLEPFESRVLGSYQRQSEGVKKLIPELYLQGLATGDFELALRGLLGEAASLSPASVTRLKEKWQGEYEIWRGQSLSDHQYLYLWCDGIYPKAGLAEDKTALLVVPGLNENGEKEPLAILEGYRESKESWSEVLRDLKARGVASPRLLIGDGALGLWAAVTEVYPQVRRGGSALLVSQDAQCFEPFPQTAAEGGEGCLTGDVLRLDQRTGFGIDG